MSASQLIKDEHYKPMALFALLRPPDARFSTFFFSSTLISSLISSLLAFPVESTSIIAMLLIGMGSWRTRLSNHVVMVLGVSFVVLVLAVVVVVVVDVLSSPLFNVALSGSFSSKFIPKTFLKNREIESPVGLISVISFGFISSTFFQVLFTL